MSKKKKAPDVAKNAPVADPRFKHEVAAMPGGENLKRCFACGTCTLSCPVAEVEPDYSPRRIIHMILLGLREEVLSSPMIWHCLACCRCEVRCPQQVKFPEIMRVLRKMALDGGYVQPEFVQALQEIDRKAQEHRRTLLKKCIEKHTAKSGTGKANG